MITDYIPSFGKHFETLQDQSPWQITQQLSSVLHQLLSKISSDYTIQDGLAIHRTATIEQGAVLKAPIIIGPNCFIAAHAYLRGGVYLGSNVTLGPGCEIKSSIVLENSSIAHFNFVGDSIIGSQVNMEAGAVIANHYNERSDKNIKCLHSATIIETGIQKFGALVGDGCKIGANAVLSPGTLLLPGTLVKRLELVEQVKA